LQKEQRSVSVSPVFLVMEAISGNLIIGAA